MKRTSSLILFLALAVNGQAQTISVQQRLDNISTFARLYGYVRYFHPSDEAAAIAWEPFLYYGIKETENAPDAAALRQKLTTLFSPIAPSVVINSAGSSSEFDSNSISPANKEGMKEVCWQHYGFGSASSLYRSIRTNRLAQIPSQKSYGFGTATASTDALPYRGKKIRLRSYIRTETNKGQGQMWLRIDKENGKTGFFDNMDSRPVKKNSWDKYEILGTVDSTAKFIVFGAFLAGSGKMWVDEFSMEAEVNGKWIAIPVDNASFDASSEKVRNWNTSSPGYAYQVVKEDMGRHNVLQVTDNVQSRVESEIFTDKPAIGEFFTRDLGNGLSCTVPLVLWGTEKQTYPAADAGALERLQNKLNAVFSERADARDPYIRLSGIVIAWNVFKHFYPYHDEIETGWAAQLVPALGMALKADTEEQYMLVLKTLTEKLKDGHVYLNGPGNRPYHSVQAKAGLAEGKIVIVGAAPPAESSGAAYLRKGDILLSVDGKPADKEFQELKSRISGSDQWKNSRALTELLAGAEGSEAVLRIKRGSEETELKQERKGYFNAADVIKTKKLADNIWYINIGATEMKEINALMPELAKAKGLVCDLRGYPRNNHEFISHLLSVKDTNKWMFVPRIIYPDYEKVSYQGIGWEMKPEKPHISAKVVFLTGGSAISYAESYMGFIKQYKLATIVGGATAGANGNVNTFSLPGNYSIRFTGMKVKQQDGSVLHGKGIQPDVFVSETLKGITEGRDECLEKALEILESQS